MTTPPMPASQQEWEAHWAFYKLTVAQRDQAWRELERIVQPPPPTQDEVLALMEDVAKRIRKNPPDFVGELERIRDQAEDERFLRESGGYDDEPDQ